MVGLYCSLGLGFNSNRRPYSLSIRSMIPIVYRMRLIYFMSFYNIYPITDYIYISYLNLSQEPCSTEVLNRKCSINANFNHYCVNNDKSKIIDTSKKVDYSNL